MVEDPKNLRGALDEAMNYRGPRPRQRPHLDKALPGSRVPLARLTG
jgi:hypothetical protein